jgi:hypothetical protein
MNQIKQNVRRKAEPEAIGMVNSFSDEKIERTKDSPNCNAMAAKKQAYYSEFTVQAEIYLLRSISFAGLGWSNPIITM